MADSTFKTIVVEPKDVQRGDMASHKDGLDPRMVTRVSDDSVWLFLLTEEHGPYPKENYTFKRQVAR